MSMEKYGVKCKCAENEQPSDGKLVKIGSQMACPHCGRNWKPAPEEPKKEDQ